MLHQEMPRDIMLPVVPEEEGRGRKGDFKKKDFYRPIKQGDDPNLIYGRSFDDEADHPWTRS